MTSLVHQPLTNYQVLPLPPRLATPEAGLLARIADTMRTWRRRDRERQELARLDDRELRDMRLSSSDVWREIRQPFWRDGAQG